MFVAAQAAPSAAPPARRRRRRLAREDAIGYLYLLPAVVLLGVWIYKPLVENLRLSFYTWNMLPTSPMKPAGLSNYGAVLAEPELHQALVNTLLYIGAALVFCIVLPVIIALTAERMGPRIKRVYEALFFMPYVITPVATSAVWRWLLNPDGGLVPTIAGHLGIHLGYLLRDPKTSLATVALIAGWQMLGFGILVVTAALTGIDPEYRAAAAVDGARPGRIRMRIVLPLLSPTLVFLTLMSILLSTQWTYPVIDMLTNGGPTGSSTNVYYLLYQFAFLNFDAGRSAAAGIVFFLAFLVIAVAFVRLSDRLSFYDN